MVKYQGEEITRKFAGCAMLGRMVPLDVPHFVLQHGKIKSCPSLMNHPDDATISVQWSHVAVFDITPSSSVVLARSDAPREGYENLMAGHEFEKATKFMSGSPCGKAASEQVAPMGFSIGRRS